MRFPVTSDTQKHQIHVVCFTCLTDNGWNCDIVCSFVNAVKPLYDGIRLGISMIIAVTFYIYTTMCKRISCISTIHTITCPIGWQSGKQHFLVLKYAFTPVAMGENESKTTIPMEILSRDGMDSDYVYHFLALSCGVTLKQSPLIPIYLFQKDWCI